MVELLDFRSHSKSRPFAPNLFSTIQNPDKSGFQIPAVSLNVKKFALSKYKHLSVQKDAQRVPNYIPINQNVQLNNRTFKSEITFSGDLLGFQFLQTLHPQGT